ncbi:MAG: hypothetical protein V1855_03985 [bacterium]
MKIFSLWLLFSCSVVSAAQDFELGNPVEQDNNVLATIPELVEQVTQQYTNDDFIQQQEKLVETYTRDEFIEAVLYPEKKRIELIKLFNERLLWELPVQKVFGSYAPRVGVYNQDVVTVCFGGVDFLVELFLYHQCKKFFLGHMTDRLSTSKPILNSLLDEKNPVLISQKFQELCAMHIHELFRSFLVGALTKYFLLHYGVHALKQRWMLDGKADGLGLLKWLCSNNEQEKHQKPMPLFSLLDVDWIFYAPTDDGLTPLLSSFNKWMAQYKLVPRVALNTGVEFVRNVTLHMIFLMWFNHYVVTNMWSQYFCEHKKEFRELFALAPEKQQDVLLQHIQTCLKGCLNTSVWNLFKRKKLAEWNMYYHVIVMIPGVYKIVRHAAKLYQEVAAPVTP